MSSAFLRTAREILEYSLLLVCSVCVRLAEQRYVTGCINAEQSVRKPGLSSFIPVGFIVTLGMMWAQTQSTLEGFGHVQRWDVTPKSNRHPAQPQSYLPGYIVGTGLISVCAMGLFVTSLWTVHLLASGFYILTLGGTAWVTASFLVELFSSKPPLSAPSLEVKSSQV